MSASVKSDSPELQRFYGRLSQQHLAPLWETLHGLVTREPSTPIQTFKWDYDRDLLGLVQDAGKLLTAQEAERRVLILENPGLPGQASTTHTLYAGVQLILPGEVARSHRHTQSALRFILQGSGAYTTVEGERIDMQPGDLITTPSWTWHDHGNETQEPMVWLDVLDIPLVKMLDASFAEAGRQEKQATVRPLGDSSVRYANNLFPVDWIPHAKYSPVFKYPYLKTRETLSTLSRNGDPNAWHGFKLRYVNPATGGPLLPSIGTFIQLLPQSLRTLPYRSTDATIHTCVEGEGETRVGDTVIAWKARDIFVTPGWTWLSHTATTSDAILFSASDRPVQEALGLWREERGAVTA